MTRAAEAERAPVSRLRTAPWWAYFLAGLGSVLLYLILMDPEYRDTFNYLRAGIVVTLRITFGAYLSAITLA